MTKRVTKRFRNARNRASLKVKRITLKRIPSCQAPVSIPSAADAAVAALPIQGASVAVSLLSSGATLPFIARYRQTQTGITSESQLIQVDTEFKRQQDIFRKKSKILKILKGRPPSRAVRMVLCDPLAPEAAVEEILIASQQRKPPSAESEEISREIIFCMQSGSPCLHDFSEKEKVGAVGVISAEILGHPGLRQKLAKIKKFQTQLVTTPVDISSDENYFARPLNQVKGYQWLKIRRQEREKLISVKFENSSDAVTDAAEICEILRFRDFLENSDFSVCQKIFGAALTRFCGKILPRAIRKDWRLELDEMAEFEAVSIFRENLMQKLLLAPVSASQPILAVDPGIAKGHKCAIVDPQGNVLHAFNFRASEIDQLFYEAEKFHVGLIAVGNGLGGPELLSLISLRPGNFSICQVDECAASVYSISPVAVRELGKFPVLTRGAVSLARRVLDPLSEFLKIPPISLGVGLYQKDISEKKLEIAANEAAAWAVAQVGLDANLVGVEVLSRLAGVSLKSAEAIISKRNFLGKFSRREEIREVVDENTFRNIAGFLRIYGASEYLDSTGVHPESYPLARKLLEIFGKFGVKTEGQFLSIFPKISKAFNFSDSSQVLEISKFFFSADPRKIKQQIFKPGDFPKTAEVAVGAEFSATVRNIVEFGIFVDLLGTSESALLHKSEFPGERNIFVIGQILRVRVIRVASGKIAVTAKF